MLVVTAPHAELCSLTSRHVVRQLLACFQTNITEAHIHHQELLVWRNYTLAAHLLADLSYTCEFVEHLNARLRNHFRLDEDDSPIN